MPETLKGKRVAILFTEGVEQSELTEPRKALEEARAKPVLITPEKRTVRAKNHHEWGESFTADIRLADANPDDFDALLLPGGVENPDALRIQAAAVRFVKEMISRGKPVAAICHGPWMLVEADVVRGRTLTSWPSLQTDIRNAGGNWTDREVVQDGQLTTSRGPRDIPAFSRQMISSFAAT
jgi:protease I